MKFILISLLLFGSPVFAQDAGVVAAAKADLQAHNVDISGSCGALKVTNYVAFRQHYALLHKAGGYRAVLRADGSCLTGEQSNDPEGFATDYVIDLSTFYGFDILHDAGGSNGPGWDGPENAPDMVARNRANYRLPFDPSTYMGGVAPPLPPVVLPPVVQPPPIITTQVCDLSNVLAAIAAVNTNVAESRIENKSFFDSVRGEWKRVLTYAAPIVGAVFLGRGMAPKQ